MEEISDKLKDWEGVHEAFRNMRLTVGKDMEQWIRTYHAKAQAYERKHGEYANPLQRPH